MSSRKRIKNVDYARRLQLEAVESRLALDAAFELTPLELKFDGHVLERWIDTRVQSDTAIIAPVAPSTLPPDAVRSVLTIINSVDGRASGTVNIDRVRDWLDRRGVEFQIAVPRTEGGYIDLWSAGDTGPAAASNAQGDLKSAGTPSENSLQPAIKSDLSAAAEPASGLPPASPLQPTSQPAQQGRTLEAWSSLGRPAVIGTTGGATNPVAAAAYGRPADVQGAAGGWIALEPILAQAEFVGLDSTRLAAPSSSENVEADAPLGEFNADLSGEWARASIFEMIGGEPTTAPSSRPGAANGQNRAAVRSDLPAVPTPATEPAITGASLSSTAPAPLADNGWLDEMALWIKSRASAAVDQLFDSDDGDESGIAVWGWRDCAGAGAVLLALALERLAMQYAEPPQSAETAHGGLRLQRAEFAHRLSMRLKPMENR